MIPEPEDDETEWIEITAWGDRERKYIQAGKPERVRLGDPIELDDEDGDDMGWELWPVDWD